MPLKRGGFERKSKESQEIPTCSLADIAFLLLIFFMVSTRFRTDRERPIAWPAASSTQRIDEKVQNILNIWVERDGSVYMNDQRFAMEEVSDVVGPLYAASDRRLIISIRGDRQVEYRTMDALQRELVSVGVVRVVFATELEDRMSQGTR